MSSDPLKVGDIHKPDIHGDSLPWETRLVNEANTAFSSMDYGPNNWVGRPPSASPEAGAFALGSSAAPSATAPSRVHLPRKPPASHASQSRGQPYLRAYPQGRMDHSKVYQQG
ncbi:uncharacterized protein CDAR_289211 [Caerostris darwini]|uniref:Uncharacterized protein n=1 Tax=Caerostris darwini TaxID=1538125 RepID=A0AAV4PFP5_9ARAC|nr:uncharacterized protein CDAR_289211 [Caerostris darwini]